MIAAGKGEGVVRSLACGFSRRMQAPALPERGGSFGNGAKHGLAMVEIHNATTASGKAAVFDFIGLGALSAPPSVTRPCNPPPSIIWFASSGLRRG